MNNDINSVGSNKKSFVYIGIIILIIAAFFVAWEASQMFGGSGAATSTPNASNNASGVQNSGSVSSNGAGGTALDALVNDPTSLHGLIYNALIQVPNTGVDVTLRNGSAPYVESTAVGTVTIDRILGETKVLSGTNSNATTSYDVFVAMNVSTKTVPLSERVGLFNVTLKGVKLTSSVLIGQNVIITGLNIVDSPAVSTQYSFANAHVRFGNIAYNAGVQYLDRKNGEAPTTTPSLAKATTFVVQGHIMAQ